MHTPKNKVTSGPEVKRAKETRQAKLAQARRIWQNATPEQRQKIALGFSKTLVAPLEQISAIQDLCANASFAELGLMADEIPDLAKRFGVKVTA